VFTVAAKTDTDAKMANMVKDEEPLTPLTMVINTAKVRAE